MRTLVVFAFSSLLMIFAGSVGSAQSCADLFGPDEVESSTPIDVSKVSVPGLIGEALQMTVAKAQELYDQMVDLERKIANWQKFNGKYERSIVVAMRHRRGQLISYLMEGDSSEASDLVRGLLRDFEVNFAKYKAGNRSPAVIKSLGENFGEYMYVRTKLESIAASTTDSPMRKAAQTMLHGLDPATVSVMFKPLDLPVVRPEVAEVRAAFDADPNMVIAKLKRDLVAERQLGIKTVVLGLLHVQDLQKLIYKILPAGIREPVTALVGLSYNSYVLNKFLPDIERILLMPEDVALRSESLRNISAKYPNDDDFLLTFVRIPQMTGHWEEMRAQITEKAKTSAIYGAFLARMQTAEANASKMRYLPLFDQASLVDRLSGAVVPTVMLVEAVIHHPTIHSLANDLSSLASLIPH